MVPAVVAPQPAGGQQGGTTPQSPATASGAAKAATPVFSLRRFPAIVSRMVAETRLTVDLDRSTGADTLGAGADHTCLTVQDPSGRTIYSRAAGTPLIPASTAKLLASATALDMIGPSTSLRTEVRGDTPDDGAVGDLWLVGGGDPLLSTVDFAVDAGFDGQPRLATSIESLADRVVAAGVRSVEGRILGDDTRYDDQRLVPTWPPRYVTGFDVGPISALTVNRGFAAGPPDPALAPSPAGFTAEVLAELLRERGVSVAGSGEGEATSASAVITSIDSPPLGDVVATILEHSDNVAAEMLVKELGVRFGAAGSTTAGLAVVAEHMASLGLPMAGVTTVDGSGLDRSNRLTCAFLDRILEEAGEGSELSRGLPVAGDNGTLHRRFIGTPAAGRVRAKTGSLRGVAALAGWVTNSRQESLQVSLMANELPSASAGFTLEDRVVSALAVYPDAPDPATIGPAP